MNSSGSPPSSTERILRRFPPSSGALSTRFTSKPWAARSSAAVIPLTPPPITRADGVTLSLDFCKGSSSWTLAMVASMRSFDFSVAFSGSCMWTHEH